MKDVRKYIGQPGGTVTTPGDKPVAPKPGGTVTTPGTKPTAGKPGGTMNWLPGKGNVGVTPEKYG